MQFVHSNSTYYTKVTEDMNAKLQQQQIWFW
jgi:hypothetical protein